MAISFIHFLFSVVLLANVRLAHPHPAAVVQAQDNHTNSVTSKALDNTGFPKTNAAGVDSLNKPGIHTAVEDPINPLRPRRSIQLPYRKRMSDQPIKDLQAILSGDYKGNTDLLRLLANFVPSANGKVYDPYYNDDEDVIDLVYYGKKPGPILVHDGASKSVPVTPLSDTISLMSSGIGSPLAGSLNDGESEDHFPLYNNQAMKHINPFVTHNSAFSKRSLPHNFPQERIQFTILPEGKLALVLRGPGNNNRYILISLPQNYFSDGIPVIQRANL